MGKGSLESWETTVLGHSELTKKKVWNCAGKVGRDQPLLRIPWWQGAHLVSR